MWNRYIEYEILARNLPMKDKVLLISNLLKKANIMENVSEHIGKNMNCMNLFSNRKWGELNKYVRNIKENINVMTNNNKLTLFLQKKARTP